MMCSARLDSEGDELEREHWPRLQVHFSGYERFWQRHVCPLRCSGSIRLKRGIDSAFERIAMCHYALFENLARSLQKIESHSDDFKFFEEIYANLHRAAEMAGAVTNTFSQLHKDCTQKSAAINPVEINRVKDEFTDYRDIIHHPRPTTVKDGSVRLVPKPDAVRKYREWTKAMYERDPADFVPVESQLNDHFQRLCAALNQTWERMERASITLVATPEYQIRLLKGDDPGLASTSVGFFVSGQIN
jgi:hypothetical protein